MLEWAGTVISDGTGRRDRIAAALQPGYFQIDERVFEQLLAMGAEFAAEVNFYNLGNQVEGNWFDVFSADEAVIMAMILSTDSKRLEAGFLRHSEGPVEALATPVLQLAQRLDFWLGKLGRSEHPSGLALKQKLEGLIHEKLAPELHNCGRILSRRGAGGETGEAFDFSVFGRPWGIARHDQGFVFARASAHGDDAAAARTQLRSAFYAFFNAISYLKTLTAAYLQESLVSERHDPALGLYMSFLKLYERARQHINRFSERHLDFYYRQVLQAMPRAALPESTHLLLEVPPGAGRTVIEQGRQFSAGKDEQFNDIVYGADTELWLSEARVAALYTLNLQRDALVAPESELGYTTRIKASRAPVVEPAQIGSSTWPLFGERKRTGPRQAADDAEIGFSIASPLLRLHEGERRIELDIALQDKIAVDADSMTSLLGRCHDRASFTELFGRLFSRYLLSREGWLSKDNKARIITIASSLLPQAASNEIAALLLQDWQGLFHKLLKRIFRIHLSSAEGWFEVDNYLIAPRRAGNGSVHGLRLCLTLGQAVAPVVPYSEAIHGAGLATEQPVLRCSINPQTHFYPYSLFDDLVIKAIELEVAVSGVTNLLLYNHHGQLDPAKPFTPFGPLPGRNAYLVVGNYELAQKPLTALQLNLEWGELPDLSGGFGAHYQGYAGDYSNDSFKAECAVLVDGRWQPRDARDQRPIALFDSAEDSARPRPDKVLQVNVLDYAKPLGTAVSEADYGYDLGSRNGFFRLRPCQPQGVFGHGEYPALLSQVLAENARRKKPRPLPNAPYTPVVNKVSLDYRARGRLDPGLDGRGEAAGRAEKIFHHHPFGVETVYPRAADQPPCLLPQYQYPGNLFIGLAATRLAGRVTLFFHLSEDHAQEVAGEAPQLRWFYLCSDRWKPLPPTRVLADTSNGFLSSGVITLDVPADIDRNHQVMPTDLYWLCVSAKGGLEGVCSGHAVYTNALQVTRRPGEGQGERPLQYQWQPMSAIAGVGRISQVGAFFGGRAAEDGLEFKTRVSERLRHKDRAAVPWDYERLILQRFTQVAKVKCLANTVSERPDPAPGHVLVVVVPQVEHAAPDARAMISSVELGRMRSYLQRRSSPQVTLEVRNPAYEQVQVRCTVKFSAGVSEAEGINRLDGDLSGYLTPWRRGGYQARFGWSIRLKDMESYIWERDYVEFVTNFSMLHITVDSSRRYRLDDTARQTPQEDIRIRPRFPWSLVLPARHHFIETTTSLRAIQAEVTGVNELEIGNTFIISGNNEYGEKE